MTIAQYDESNILSPVTIANEEMSNINKVSLIYYFTSQQRNQSIATVFCHSLNYHSLTDEV